LMYMLNAKIGYLYYKIKVHHFLKVYMLHAGHV